MIRQKLLSEGIRKASLTVETILKPFLQRQIMPERPAILLAFPECLCWIRISVREKAFHLINLFLSLREKKEKKKKKH